MHMERGEQNVAREVLQEKRRVEALDAHIDDFLEIIDSQVTDEGERMELDRTAGKSALFHDAVAFALMHPDRFAEPLAELIRNIYIATGTRITNPLGDGGLFVDPAGNIAVTRGEVFAIPPAVFDETHQKYGSLISQRTAWKGPVLIRGEYELLTGPDAGRKFATTERPLWKPMVQPGTSAEA